MYTIFKETDAATAVEFAAFCRFLNGDDRQLVTIGANHLRVFRLNPFVLTRGHDDGSWVQQTRLECLLSVTLFAPVRSFAVARLPGAATDCLLLAFEEAKLSVVAYDAAAHDLHTVSLHAFEEELLRGGFTRDFPLPLVCADPDSRCAAVLVYGRHLGVLPLQCSPEGLFDDAADAKPPPSLHSYAVALDSLDERLANVADMCFLHGYYEPTLLMLYEPNQTTVSRIALRQDTYCILAVSLNVKDRVHAVIWTVALLPYDCRQCVAAPKPVGGVVVFATNSVIYLNQSVPAYGVAVNSCNRGVTSFPLHDQMSQRITLDRASVAVLTPTTFVVTTHAGAAYVLNLLVDNTNVVKGMQLERAFDSATPSCACASDDGYLFAGSRLGDSALWRFAEDSVVAVKVANEPPSAKRARFDGVDAAPSAGDDMAIYGEVVAVSSVESIRVCRYRFESSDLLVNIGPCKHAAVGGAASVPAPLQTGQQLDPVFDLVFASGHGTDGAVVALQRSLRPKILTDSHIDGALQMWTVGQTAAGDHRYLLLSKEVITMVLELRDEISELESSGFVMEQRTIGAGELDGGRYIVQVVPMFVVLLRGAERVQEVALDVSFPVASVSVIDPYVLLLTENGQVLFLHLVPAVSSQPDGNMKLVLSQPPIGGVPVTALSGYCDNSGLFVLSQSDVNLHSAGQRETSPQFVDQKPSTHSLSDDVGSLPLGADVSFTAADEDALLYGESSAPTKSSAVDVKPPVNGPAERSGRSLGDVLYERTVRVGAAVCDPNAVMPSYWLAVARENGLLEIFSLPDFRAVFVARRFAHCGRLVRDAEPSEMALDVDKADEHAPLVRDLLLVGLGANNARPHLLAVVDDELVLYELFRFDAGHADHLAVRFKRLRAGAVLRNERLVRARRRSTASSSLDHYRKLLHPFEGVGAYNGGVFVAGPYPQWCFVGQQLRLHPMQLDGAVRSFAPFNNANCRNGFLYLEERTATMRVCQLQPEMDYEQSQPMRKTRLGRDVHLVVYMLQSDAFAVVTSESAPSQRLVSVIGDDKHFDTVEKPDDADFVWPLLDAYRVQLFAPDSWQPIAGAGELQMDEFEVVTVAKEVALKSEGTLSGVQNYLAVGTVYNYGEEVLVRGRVFIVEVVEVVPDPDQPTTKNKMKTLYCKEQKGPVTSLCSCKGYFLTGMGQKIYIWAFRDNDLVGISFLDMHCYVSQMVGLRSLALVADMYRSVSLLRYQENCKALSVASRDLRPVPHQSVPMAVEFLVDNKQLAFLMSDELDNLTVFCYQPEAKESLGGERLLRRGQMHVGARVSAFCRVQAHVGDGVVENKQLAVNRHLVLFGTLDGALAYVAPVPEKVFRRLHMLQNALTAHLAHAAGLHPRGCRLPRAPRCDAAAGAQQAGRNVLDGDVVCQFFALSLPERADLAKRLGTSRDLLVDDLLEIIRSSTHF